jgi:ribosome-associated protein
MPRSSHVDLAAPVGGQPERGGDDGPVQDIPITDDVIRLGQFLKLAGVVDSGAETKGRIAAGEVRVNGVVETRRGAQLHRGDVVTIDNERLRVS